ncbi:MAG: carbohydrate binding domain-containing protein [Tannerella sp.]|jgi:alpha-L-arabinofuranosidase|nr:carbohydrate binding domain-containing protein [Tannerella sp.]
MDVKKYTGFLCLLLLLACKPEPLITSDIVIDMDKLALPVNADLYGLTIEEVNHAIEGGIYGELIQNRSFEDGILPAGCQFDLSRRYILTPSGWKIPFARPNTVPGWRALSDQTALTIDTERTINKENNQSLYVRVSTYGKSAFGGVVAEGFSGIPLQKGEQYDLFMYIRGRRVSSVAIGLRDSMAYRPLSDVYRIQTMWGDWTKVRHTFTATENARNATLVFSTDSGASFNMDMVSLFPKKTWKGRPNGLRPELMEAIAALNPKFIRFPGGASAEGYASSTIPRWEETIGPVETRKPVWSIWGYGTSSGMGFYEYLQMCEDLEAQPVYVANPGMLNQRYRLQFDELENIDLWTQRIENALGYAGYGRDSIYGQRRIANGHAKPFEIKQIEIGNENRGNRYVRRYQSIRQALKKLFPSVSIISNDTAAINNLWEDWIDTHFTTNADFLTGNHNCFDVENITIQTPMNFVGEFGASYSPIAGTLKAAIGEAAFLIGAERNPMNMKGVAYSPVLGNTAYPFQGVPAIQFDGSRIVKTPSYYVLEMFGNNRGDELLKTGVTTYLKPLVTYGRVAIAFNENQFAVKDMALDGVVIPSEFTEDERMNINLQTSQRSAQSRPETTTRSNRYAPPAASQSEKPRYVLFGDSMSYNYTFTTQIKRIQPGGKIQIRVRDNGLPERQSDFISLTMDDGKAGVYHCAGRVERPLAAPVPLSLDENRWYSVKIVCEDDHIDCYVDDNLLIEASVLSMPSLVAVATHETETGIVILKVVNTTYHEEWTSLRLLGKNMDNEADIIQLTGQPEALNTFDHPEAIVPKQTHIKFTNKEPVKYVFPGNSITIIRMKVK